MGLVQWLQLESVSEADIHERLGQRVEVESVKLWMK